MPTVDEANPTPGKRRTPVTLFQPVRTRRTVENVVAQIVEHIKDGELDTGDALPGERQLATQMEVSRRTIRQAIGVLAEAGVLSVLPGPAGGIRVQSIWLPAQFAEQGVPLSPDGVIEVLEARRTIEPRVAQLAALRATDADFAAMRGAIELQRAVADDREKLNQANTLFHRAMWRSARNASLDAAMRLIWDSLEVALDMTSRTADRPRGLAATARTDAGRPAQGQAQRGGGGDGRPPALPRGHLRGRAGPRPAPAGARVPARRRLTRDYRSKRAAARSIAAAWCGCSSWPSTAAKAAR